MKKLDWTIFLIGFAFGVMCTLSIVGTITKSINEELRNLHLEHELLKMKIELKEAKLETEANAITTEEKSIDFTYRGNLPTN